MKKIILTIALLSFNSFADIVVIHGMNDNPSTWQSFGAKLSKYTGKRVVYYNYKYVKGGKDERLAVTGGGDYYAKYTKLLKEKNQLESELKKLNNKTKKRTSFIPAHSMISSQDKKRIQSRINNINRDIKFPEAVVKEEKAILNFLNCHKSGGLNVVAHSLGSSLFINAVANASKYKKRAPYINVTVFLGSNMNQGNFCRTFPIAKNSIGRIYNVYSGSDRGSAAAFGHNLGKEGFYNVQCLNSSAQIQIKNIDSKLKTKGFKPLSGSHSRYREIPFRVATLITTELKCEKPPKRDFRKIFKVF